MSNNRSREIRAIMAETGMKYCAAMRELERREASAGPGPEASPAAPDRTFGDALLAPLAGEAQSP